MRNDQSSKLLTFSSCHRFSIGLASGLSGGVHYQFTPFWSKNAFETLKVCFVLHKVVTVLILRSLKCRQESNLYNMYVHWCIHYAIKNTDFGGSMPSNSSLHKHLHWMLLTRFWARSPAFLPAAESLMAL